MATEFTIPLHRFDTNLLPADARQVGTDAFKTAVMMHFAAEYAAQGQTEPPRILRRLLRLRMEPS